MPRKGKTPLKDVDDAAAASAEAPELLPAEEPEHMQEDVELSEEQLAEVNLMPDCNPLQSSTAMANLSKKLGLIEAMRHTCQAVDIPLPGIVVTGEQSAGKSSLLESISGIQFPRDENTCTRMPCVLTLLTEDTEPYVLVSMDASFQNTAKCELSQVSFKIRTLTEKNAVGSAFISRKPIYVRVVRKEGPQLSLIDLPGMAYNSPKMEKIHEVTQHLVETYIKEEQMVILCVVPALSDFGNAEAIQLARKYDVEGIRTLGVVTKCDDAARAESSDVVEKVTMARDSDVKLKLGFHAVINRSQKNIKDGMSHDEVWEKEKNLFQQSERLSRISQSQWGTLRLMEKIASIQSSRVDQCLPKIKESVRETLAKLRKEKQELPPQIVSDDERNRHFNELLRKVSDDIRRRVRAEFMSPNLEDTELAIAPRVADTVIGFRDRLREENPRWLEEDMINQVDSAVENFVHGYTVDNLVGPQIFINLIKRVFVEDRLLAEASGDLVDDVAKHLGIVLSHVVTRQAGDFHVLGNHLIEIGHEVIDEAKQHARNLCEIFAESQQVTSTTQSSYMVCLQQFRKSMFDKALDEAARWIFGSRNTESLEDEMPEEFIDMIRSVGHDAKKFAVLEICASLHVYSNLLIEGFADMVAKLVKFEMVEKLTKKLEGKWRAVCSGKMSELFPQDEDALRRKQVLEEQIQQLEKFKAQLMHMRPAAPLVPQQLSRPRFGQQMALEQNKKYDGARQSTFSEPAKTSSQTKDGQESAASYSSSSMRSAAAPFVPTGMAAVTINHQ